MRFAKAFFSGLKGRGALRSAVRRAIGAQNATGREHGFHAGKAGVDRSLQRGKAGGIKWSPRASVGQMLGGGALHHTHPKGHGRLSPQDLRSVVTAPNSKGGRNTLWAHSSDGHEAARLTRTAAGQHPKVRAKAFNAAYRATKAPGQSPYNHGRALRSELKRRGLIHSSSTVRKLNAAIANARGMLMTKLIETDEVEKASVRFRGVGMSRAQRRAVAVGGKHSAIFRLGRGASSTGGEQAFVRHKRNRRTWPISGARANTVRKSLAALDTAIAKARGMLPPRNKKGTGGSARMWMLTASRRARLAGNDTDGAKLKGKKGRTFNRLKNAGHYLAGRANGAFLERGKQRRGSYDRNLK